MRVTPIQASGLGGESGYSKVMISGSFKDRFFRPFEAGSFFLNLPRLAPWAAFLRRFAANRG
jgi:hypothetical protein